jgi:hypothetical protein
MKSTHQIDLGTRGTDPRQRLANPTLAQTAVPVLVSTTPAAGSAAAATMSGSPFASSSSQEQQQLMVRDNLKFISSSIDMHQGTIKATKSGVPGEGDIWE